MFWLEVFFETSPYERAESPLSNDTKLVNFHIGKKLKQSIWKYMVNILDQYEPMYFQTDCFNFFPIWKLTSLVSLERGDSALSYGEVSKKISMQKKFFGLTGVAPFILCSPYSIGTSFLYRITRSHFLSNGNKVRILLNWTNIHHWKLWQAHQNCHQ